MNNYLLNSIIIGIIYFIIKFIEMRFVEKEAKPLKDIIKETALVFLSSILGGYILEQFKIPNLLGSIKEIPKVFTNDPGF